MRTVTDDASQRPRGRSLAVPAALAVGLFVGFSANGRLVGAGDTVPAMYLAVALARGDGPWLDRFEHVLRHDDGRLTGYATDAKGHAVSRYPIGPALVALPFIAPQVAYLDRTSPSWERQPATARRACERMAKNAAAAIVALTAAVHVLLLRQLGLGRVAVPAALIVALGSDDWSTASQALWQHGPAELMFAVAVWLLTATGPNSRTRLALAGLATAMMVVCRPIDLVFAGPIAIWALGHHDRPERWSFFLPAALAAILLCVYNVHFFETLTGGYSHIEKMHPWAHGTRGTFTGSLVEGAMGTLFSPSHGLLVYCPWVAIALAVWPRSRVALSGRARALLAWLLFGLLVNFVLLSTYSCWWGGHCFGPRFWIDANPVFLILVALALEWSLRERRPVLMAALLTGFLSAAAMQAVGFLAYPSSWHSTPTNADRDHGRLWDWSDSELTRCWKEGIRARTWSGLLPEPAER